MQGYQGSSAGQSGRPGLGLGAENCQFCNRPIIGPHYIVNKSRSCEPCAKQARMGAPQDSPGAYRGALLLGIGAAVVGMVLYAAFTILTGIEIGYMSLAVGLLVGLAIMMGSNGIGGRRYQVTALLLTYAAVTVAAVPIGLGLAMEQHVPLAQSRMVRQLAQESEPSGGDTETPASSQHAAPTLASAILMLLMYGLGSPVLAMMNPLHGIIGLVVLLAGLHIAWRITAAKRMKVKGPFRSDAMQA